MWAVVVDIFEPEGLGVEVPIIRHIMFGRTKTEALHYLDSHRKSDKFLRDCMDERKFGEVKCFATMQVYELE